jgi:hypothetical protein
LDQVVEEEAMCSERSRNSPFEAAVKHGSFPEPVPATGLFRETVRSVDADRMQTAWTML